MNMCRNAAKKALINQKKKVGANQQRLGLDQEEPADPATLMRQVEMDTMKMMLLENHLILLQNDANDLGDPKLANALDEEKQDASAKEEDKRPTHAS